ncbi:hypothetical protein K1719_021835 [Acacia pycnantha]|nr:hypothetical protein K1719_021835 [Acacia pycnantha]
MCTFTPPQSPSVSGLSSASTTIFGDLRRPPPASSSNDADPSPILLLQFRFTNGRRRRRGNSLVRTVVRLSHSLPPSLSGGLCCPLRRRVSLPISSPYNSSVGNTCIGAPP